MCSPPITCPCCKSSLPPCTMPADRAHRPHVFTMMSRRPRRMLPMHAGLHGCNAGAAAGGGVHQPGGQPALHAARHAAHVRSEDAGPHLQHGRCGRRRASHSALYQLWRHQSRHAARSCCDTKAGMQHDPALAPSSGACLPKNSFAHGALALLGSVLEGDGFAYTSLCTAAVADQAGKATRPAACCACQVGYWQHVAAAHPFACQIADTLDPAKTFLCLSMPEHGGKPVCSALLACQCSDGFCCCRHRASHGQPVG